MGRVVMRTAQTKISPERTAMRQAGSQALGTTMRAVWAAADRLRDKARVHLTEMGLDAKLKNLDPETKTEMRRYLKSIEPNANRVFKVEQAMMRIEEIEKVIVAYWHKLLDRSKTAKKTGYLSYAEGVDLTVYSKKHREETFALLAQMKEHAEILKDSKEPDVRAMAVGYLDSYDKLDAMFHDYTWLVCGSTHNPFMNFRHNLDPELTAQMLEDMSEGRLMIS